LTSEGAAPAGDPYAAFLLQVLELIERGFRPIPIPLNEKGPNLKEWPSLRLTRENFREYFPAVSNVGGIWGAESKKVDVDLDTREAILAADVLLPPTNCMYGRASAPRSHRIYCPTPVVTFETYGLDKSLVEIRTTSATGKAHQSVLPPSIHPSGESYTWDAFGEPAAVNGNLLRRQVTLVAIAAGFARLHPPFDDAHKQARNEFRLSVSGFLARRFADDQARSIFRAVLAGARDPELFARVELIDDTFAKFKANPFARIPGIPKLKTIIGPVAFEKIFSWVNIAGANANGHAAHTATASRIAIVPPIGITGSRREDTSNADRFVAQHKEIVRYACERKKWLKWDGRRWQEDTDNAVLELAKNTARSIYIEAAARDLGQDDRLATAKWAEKSMARDRLSAMLDLARTDPAVVVLEDKLDADPWLLNCWNGTIDLRIGQLRPHDKADLITKICAAEYDDEMDCPQWRAFLLTCFDGKRELVDFVQRTCGYTATGSVREQVWHFLYGLGSNGKSTFVSVLAELLGDYTHAAGFESFTYLRNGHGTRNDLAAMKGARLVHAAETAQGQRLDDAILKQLTGGDKLTTRFLYQELFTFQPAFKLFISGNSLPALTDTSHASWRRVRLIPFNHTIDAADRIDDFARLLLDEERTGIFAWIIEGCRLWLDHKLSPPAEVLAATADYQQEQNHVAKFVHERCTTPVDGRCSARELYQAFRVWSEEQGSRSKMSKTAFTQELRRLGHPLDRGERHYLGIDLADEPGKAHSDDTIPF